MDFEKIYKEYFTEIYLYLRGLSASGDLAEEIAQETFVKALRTLDRFDGSENIRAWLYTIAKNTYFTHLRRQKRFVDEPYEEAAERIGLQGTGGTDMVTVLADRELALAVHQFIHGMDEPYKEVFHLRVFGELPFEQIGKIFGRSAGWARVTFYRARKQILEYMEVMDGEN